jgi:hypothetical protein
MKTRQRVSLFACYLPADDFVPVGPKIWGRIFFYIHLVSHYIRIQSPKKTNGFFSCHKSFFLTPLSHS